MTAFIRSERAGSSVRLSITHHTGFDKRVCDGVTGNKVEAGSAVSRERW